MKIHFVGHSAVLLQGGANVLIDPFLEGPTSTLGVQAALDLPLHAVVITHAHADHFGSAPELARAGVPVIAPVEIAAVLAEQGAPNAIGSNIGGTTVHDWGSVRFTPALHSSSFDDGRYGGMPTGVVIEMDGKRVYHAGDTAAFSDMASIGDLGLDAALLPVGDHYTMGHAEAARCLDHLRPRVAVPIHWGTFETLHGDPHEFAKAAEAAGHAAQVLRPGESLTI